MSPSDTCTYRIDASQGLWLSERHHGIGVRRNADGLVPRHAGPLAMSPTWFIVREYRMMAGTATLHEAVPSRAISS